MTFRAGLMCSISALCLLGATTVAHAAAVVGDASFENPALPNTGYGNGNNFLYDPSGTPWTYTGSAGVSANGGPFYAGSAPDGSQAAFLQANVNNGTSTIAATVTGLIVGQTYDVTFFEASRPGFGVTPLQVFINGVSLGSYTNSSSSFIQQTSNLFTATATTATLSFVATNTVGNDNDVNLDNVGIVQVPEPASLALFGLVALATIATRRNSRQA